MWRQLVRIGDVAPRLLRHYSRIGVPFHTDDPHVARLAPNLQDLRVRAGAVVIRVNEDITKAPSPRFMLGRIELLVAEEDHAVIEQRPPNIGHPPVIEIFAPVDAVAFGADRARECTYIRLAVSPGLSSVPDRPSDR